jgi:4-hydroxy-2-oxoheptanedioate aldolase
MIRSNRTLTLLRRGEAAIGTWLQLCSPHAARLLAAQGLFDWMLVDFEHTPIDLPTASLILSTVADLSAGRITPLARVLSGTVENIKQALDAGAQGVIVPMVGTAAEAALAVRAARFPPHGERGGGALAAHLGFGVSRPEYLAEVNAQILVGVQIETAQGVDNIEEIVRVPGVDLVFIGPNDLHMALGAPAKFWSDEPAFIAAVGRVQSACQRVGMPLGTLCRDAVNVKARRQDGYAFLGMGSDAHFMLTYAGLQHGERCGIAEPAETWCNHVRLPEIATRPEQLVQAAD